MRSRASRVLHSLRTQGVTTTTQKLIDTVADKLFDLRHGVDTSTWTQLEDLSIVGANRDHGRAYQATRIRSLRRVLKWLRPHIDSGKILVDLGCGKGRVLLVAAELGFEEVRGVEFAEELCATARRNCERYFGRKRLSTRFHVEHADAANYEIKPSEHLFFMFNPFDHIVMGRVLDNIQRSCAQYPRRVMILYHCVPGTNPIDDHPYFARRWKRTIGGSDFLLFTGPGDKIAA